MGSQTFDGFRFSVKFPWIVVAHLQSVAKGTSREEIVRAWVEDRRTLFGLAPSLHQRLVYAAKQRHQTLAAVINDILTQYCTTLPPVPEGVVVKTTIDVPDDEPSIPDEEEAPKKRTAKK